MESTYNTNPGVICPLDPDFSPLITAIRSYRRRFKEKGTRTPLVIRLERNHGAASVFRTEVSSDPSDLSDSIWYAERIVKSLLWIRGGWKITVGGPQEIGDYISQVYSQSGERAFDAEFMGGVYGQPFTVEVVDAESVPGENEESLPLGRHLDGCRIGFDLGASDRKVAAVIDGNAVFSEEIPWDPRNQTSVEYHYNEIMDGLRRAASHMSRVDSIGGSSAGVYIGNQVKVASLFRGIQKDRFESDVTNIFFRMKQEWGGIPFEVVNDGEVTALAGAMALNDTAVLGIALGSSEAGGYANRSGNITGWLNELAFVPIDIGHNAPCDEWSGDCGVGALYLSQQAVFRLAPAAGITIDKSLQLADKLKYVQELLIKSDNRAIQIFETIGVYLGYAIAYYAEFYDIKHVLALGRVTSYQGGQIILDRAREVLATDFPEVAESLEIHLPDEAIRRVGQAVAAASLPVIE